MAYRLIATDLDGTLFGHDLVISERTRKALRAARARNIEVCVATGRMFCSALKVTHPLGLSAPLITYQGALVGNPVTREFLWHQVIARELADRVIQDLQAMGLHVNLYIDDRLLLEHLTPEAERYTALNRMEAEQVKFSDIGGDPTKIVAIGDPEELTRAVDTFQGRFGDRLSITTSIPEFLEFTVQGAHKGAALAKVCRRLDIAPHEVIAFGDGMNDASMLEFAGLGVAMASGSQRLCQLAQRVAPAMEQDGVAQILEELVLN